MGKRTANTWNRMSEAHDSFIGQADGIFEIDEGHCAASRIEVAQRKGKLFDKNGKQLSDGSSSGNRAATPNSKLGHGLTMSAFEAALSRDK